MNNPEIFLSIIFALLVIKTTVIVVEVLKYVRELIYKAADKNAKLVYSRTAKVGSIIPAKGCDVIGK